MHTVQCVQAQEWEKAKSEIYMADNNILVRDETISYVFLFDLWTLKSVYHISGFKNVNSSSDFIVCIFN